MLHNYTTHSIQITAIFTLEFLQCQLMIILHGRTFISKSFQVKYCILLFFIAYFSILTIVKLKRTIFAHGGRYWNLIFWRNSSPSPLPSSILPSLFDLSFLFFSFFLHCQMLMPAYTYHSLSVQMFKKW